MYYYTVSIDEEGMMSLLDELKERVNAPFKRRKPFGVVVTQEQLDDAMSAQVMRFHLVVTPDCAAKSERQALRLFQGMEEALEEVRAANEANYIVVPPPRRGAGK